MLLLEVMNMCVVQAAPHFRLYFRFAIPFFFFPCSLTCCQTGISIIPRSSLNPNWVDFNSYVKRSAQQYLCAWLLLLSLLTDMLNWSHLLKA
jgi:hypothetical protein